MKPHAGCYEIRIAENLEAHWLPWFSDLQIFPKEGDPGPGTLLYGRLPDQAALFGLLGRIRDLNLTLLELRRVDPLSGS
jgi:hypothetical protein